MEQNASARLKLTYVCHGAVGAENCVGDVDDADGPARGPRALNGAKDGVFRGLRSGGDDVPGESP